MMLCKEGPQPWQIVKCEIQSAHEPTNVSRDSYHPVLFQRRQDYIAQSYMAQSLG